MKKHELASPLAVISVVALVGLFGLVGCSHSEVPIETEPLVERETLPPEEEKALVDKAYAAISEQFRGEGGLLGREHLEPRVMPGHNGDADAVWFYVRIGNYATREAYCAFVEQDGTVRDCRVVNPGDFSCYLDTATPAAIAAAEAELEAFLASYDDYKGGGGYLTVDKEGYLCLSAEIIVEKKMTLPWEDEDHEHKFFNVRICKAEE
jgi:hypothetical protein